MPLRHRLVCVYVCPILQTWGKERVWGLNMGKWR